MTSEARKYKVKANHMKYPFFKLTLFQYKYVRFLIYYIFYVILKFLAIETC